MKQAGRIGLIGLVLAATSVRGASLWAEEAADALALAVAGVACLDRLDRSPGAPVAPEFRLRLSRGTPFVGSGLVAGAVGLQSVHGRWGSAASVAQVASDVHRDAELAFALQLRPGNWRWGGAATVRELRFDGQPPLHEFAVRVGAGLSAPVRAAVAVEHTLGTRSIRVSASAAVRTAPGFDLLAQVEREPGLPPRVRLGAAWGKEAVEVRSGYDVATRAATGGLVLGLGGWRLAWAASTHPDLGWSHAWTLEFRRS